MPSKMQARYRSAERDVSGHGSRLPAASQPEPSAQARRPAWPLVLACCLLLILALGMETIRWRDRPDAADTAAGNLSASGRTLQLTELSQSIVPMPKGVPSAHASSLAILPGNAMLMFWWAGTRESAPDVKVYSSRWTKGAWGPSREIASRDSLGAALGFGVRRVGNPVAWTAADGRVHLFVVGTGLGGWAASRIIHLVSSDSGQHFDVKRVLPMSALFNTSVLVRAAPVGLTDGGWWLPAYFELGNKYSLIMSFGESGEPRWLGRIGARSMTLQPAFAPVSARGVRAWMRDASEERRVQQAISHDGGASWQDLPALDLVNHSSSVAVKRLQDGGYVLLHNHVEPGKSGRNTLRLSYSKDAHTWTRMLDVIKGDDSEEFSYPELKQIGDELHVSYTSRRTAIAHHVYRITYGGAQ